MESFMLDICHILFILFEIWKLEKEKQLYFICLGTARYFFFNYLRKYSLFMPKLVLILGNPSQIHALMQNLLVFLYNSALFEHICTYNC